VDDQLRCGFGMIVRSKLKSLKVWDKLTVVLPVLFSCLRWCH